MLNSVRRLFKKRVMRVRVEGPIDIKNEAKILKQLDSVQKRKIDSLIIIVNSYGGSLRVAKNISDYIKGIKNKQIPIYCFAQQFCLNSANLILTVGSQCYASKLSVIGDFGFADERYEFSQQFQKNWISRQKISSGSIPLDIWKGYHQLAHDKDIETLINGSASELKNLVLENRQQALHRQSLNLAEFREQFLQGGAMSPSFAAEQGLIDGILNSHKFIKERLDDHRVVEGRDEHQYRAINFLRSGLQVFKQQ